MFVTKPDGVGLDHPGVGREVDVQIPPDIAQHLFVSVARRSQRQAGERWNGGGGVGPQRGRILHRQCDIPDGLGPGRLGVVFPALEVDLHLPPAHYPPAALHILGQGQEESLGVGQLQVLAGTPLLEVRLVHLDATRRRRDSLSITVRKSPKRQTVEREGGPRRIWVGLRTYVA